MVRLNASARERSTMNRPIGICPHRSAAEKLANPLTLHPVVVPDGASSIWRARPRALVVVKAATSRRSNPAVATTIRHYHRPLIEHSDDLPRPSTQCIPKVQEWPSRSPFLFCPYPRPAVARRLTRGCDIRLPRAVEALLPLHRIGKPHYMFGMAAA